MGDIPNCIGMGSINGCESLPERIEVSFREGGNDFLCGETENIYYTPKAELNDFPD